MAAAECKPLNIRVVESESKMQNIQKINILPSGAGNSPVQFAKLFPIILSLVYGLIVSGVRDYRFYDYQNYIDYVTHSEYMLTSNLIDSFLVVVANEPIWLLLNIGLNGVFEPEVAVRWVVAISAFLTVWRYLTHDVKNIWFLLLFLCLPIVVKNNLVHVRQGVGISILIATWFSGSKTHRWLGLLIAMLVHSSVAFLVVIYAVSVLLERWRIPMVYGILVYCCYGFLLSYGLEAIASVVGARQSQEYDFKASLFSGSGFIFWMMILIILLFEEFHSRKSSHYGIGILICYLTTYWFIEVSSRIFESGLLLVLPYGCRLVGFKKWLFVAMIVFYANYMWLSRLSQPLLGFEAAY